ncbi:hypothetical protein [Rhodococcus rhodochrous]|uniref:hypothetical protein n=1 Tax=Rhodococcus rhodochrous TaxID=1829 RepID=UPI0024B9F6DA|nr:hypothetical protein [Rhodococcus rhodochrous]MDJ0401242.1 hypothetical protein [Rhodococcus rhodochrous]
MISTRGKNALPRGSFEEAPNASSEMGLARPDLEHYALQESTKLKMYALGAVIALIVVTLVGGIVAFTIPAVQTGEWTNMQQFCTVTFSALLSVFTGIVGYLFGQRKNSRTSN